MNEQPTLLVVDDDEPFRTRLSRALTDRGFAVTTAGSADEALAAVSESPEYAVLDLRMPGRSGLELLAALKERDPNTRVVMLTGYGSIPTAVEATKKGATAYLTKPADADDVVRALLGEGQSSQSEVGTPSLARAEWEYIHRVMADCGDNVSEAARRLGIHRRSLQRKLQKYPPAR
ncbi:MAG: response regulator transcription factor [Myxococcota bacterium]